MEHRMADDAIVGWVEVAAAGGFAVPASYREEA